MEFLNHLDQCGFRVAAVFDPDPLQVGTQVGALRVQSLDALPAAVEELNLAVGIVGVPSHTAQACAEALLAAGIRSILNLSGCWIMASAPALVRNCNLIGELFILSYQHRAPTRQSSALPSDSPQIPADTP